MTEQPSLDVLTSERRAQERVVQQVDLPHRQVVGGAPVGVDACDVLISQRERSRRYPRRVLFPTAYAVVLKGGRRG